MPYNFKVTPYPPPTTQAEMIAVGYFLDPRVLVWTKESWDTWRLSPTGVRNAAVMRWNQKEAARLENNTRLKAAEEKEEDEKNGGCL